MPRRGIGAFVSAAEANKPHLRSNQRDACAVVGLLTSSGDGTRFQLERENELMNSVNLIGNVTQAPEYTTFPSG